MERQCARRVKRKDRLANVSLPGLPNIVKCILASIFEKLAAVAATKGITKRRNELGRERRRKKKKKRVSIDIVPAAPRLNHIDRVT